MQQIVERTLTLNAQIQRISEVVSVVANIAAEIHLLALNASIEAAGAGLPGERFSIVAVEVKKLARRTQQATDRIRELVLKVQQANTASGWRQRRG